MAAVSTSRRSIAGIILIVAGALYLIGILLGLAGVVALGYWPALLANLGIGAAFLIMGIASFRNTLARIALVVGAVGWIFLALSFLVALPSPIGAIAAVAAAAGGVVAAIVLYVGKEITNRSAIAFILTTVVGAIILLAAVFGVALGTFGTVLAIVFALGLIVTGVLFARVQGDRGR